MTRTRICAMVPPPWFNMVRFHGVLAPNAKLRAQVVASAQPYVAPNAEPSREPLQLPPGGVKKVVLSNQLSTMLSTGTVRPGLSTTGPTGVQFLVAPDQRRGFRLRAFW